MRAALRAGWLAGAIAATGCPHVDPGPAVYPPAAAGSATNPSNSIVPSPAPNALAAPLVQPGRTWVYDLGVNQPDQAFTGEVTLEVTAAEDAAATLRLTTTRTGESAQETRMGISLTSEPYAMLGRPLGGPALTLSSSALEDVEVPAGSFRGAFHLRYSAHDESDVYDVQQWIAEGIGLVRQDATRRPVLTTPKDLVLSYTTTWRLKRYTP